MASKNEVTLTFAGDSTDLEKAFGRVGQSADEMSSEVDSASTKVRSSAEGFDKAGEATDALDTKAMGFRDTMTGVQDTMAGVGDIAKGNLFEGFLTLGMGVGDLASGMTNFLIPSLKSVITSGRLAAVSMVKSAGRQVAAWAVLGAKSLLHAGKVALAWLIAIGPIAIVIAAVVGLVVLIVKNWDTIWRVTKRVWGAVWGFIKRLWDRVKEFIGNAVGRIKDIFFRFHPLGIIIRNWNPVMDFFRSIPGKIGGFFSRVGEIIAAPFRNAFNGIRSLWNSTVGGRGFTVPDWVPFIGNKEFRIPTLHQGGIVPGSPGSETLALLQAGEKVSPASQQPKTVALSSDGSALSDLIIETLRSVVRAEGGNVQFVLGQG